eukprot:1153896-Pelagomonas_calceolata.AAC.2
MRLEQLGPGVNTPTVQTCKQASNKDCSSIRPLLEDQLGRIKKRTPRAKAPQIPFARRKKEEVNGDLEAA